MSTWRKVGCCLVAAVAAFGAFGYEDEFISTSDETVRTNWVGDKIVYVFTNAAATTTVTFKRQMSVEQTLVVGGGGAGGWTIGGGGGGGEVRYSSAVHIVEPDEQATLTVGAGGDVNGIGTTWKTGGNGGASELVLGGETITAYGGGGGASYDTKTPNTGTLASGGGSANGSGTAPQDGVHYTSGRGYPGGGSGGSNLSGGGGGAGEKGGSGSGSKAGRGGEGKSSSITGSPEVYGSGGGGGGGNGVQHADGGTNAGKGGANNAATLAECATSGKDGYGAGGGGGCYNSKATTNVSGGTIGGRGGCGTVILSIAYDLTGRFFVDPLGWTLLVDGKAEPKPVVRDYLTHDVLAENEDYELSYRNNTSIGTATVVVTGVGARAGRGQTAEFQIVRGYSDENIVCNDDSLVLKHAGDKVVYVFTNVAEKADVILRKSLVLDETLVVGGGGAGGWTIGGGGGGGGVVFSTPARQMHSGETLAITVGAGGDGLGPYWREQSFAAWQNGGNGGNSTLQIGTDAPVTAYGGGGGANYNSKKPNIGTFGSGGGCSNGGTDGTTANVHYTPSQGNPGGVSGGGDLAGGGGGAGAAAEKATTAASKGGEGLVCSITGVDEVYGSGGGGGGGNGKNSAAGGTNAGKGGANNAATTAQLPTSGTDGYGAGGGGGCYRCTLIASYSSGTRGGDGGCGTVILAFSALNDKTFGIAPVEPQAMNPSGAVTPALTVSNLVTGAILERGVHYTVEYADNMCAGQATATVTGIGDYEGQTKVVAFSILNRWEDERLSVEGDATCVRLQTDGRYVYVFTNATREVELSFRGNVTIERTLVVGGGGAGGWTIGGGGGGGEVVASDLPRVIRAGGRASVRVGAGGDGVGFIYSELGHNSEVWKVGCNGGESSLRFGSEALVARGGGGGASYAVRTPNTGTLASGGGCANGCTGGVDGLHYDSAHGFPGGAAIAENYAGGGGGAGGAGQDGAKGQAGRGGEGVTNSITGVAEVYGSGGGGGGGNNFQHASGGTNAGRGGLNNASTAAQVPTAGRNGFGAGGGGGCYRTSLPLSYDGGLYGGNGGSGTVILAIVDGGEVGQPEIASADLVFGDTVQPSVEVEVGGDGIFSATLGVKVGFGASGWDYEISRQGCNRGTVWRQELPYYPRPGSTIRVYVLVTADGVESRERTFEVTVPADKTVPAFVGKGGGAGVIHVRYGARGLGTGENWADAYTDMASAAAGLRENRAEIWVAEEGAGHLGPLVVNVGFPIAVRGGFAGTESGRGERPKGACSALDAGFFSGMTPLQLVTTASAEFERLRFLGGTLRNAQTSGGGNLSFADCEFAGSRGFALAAGRGGLFTGVAGTTEAVFSNCVFRGNLHVNAQSSSSVITGGGACFKSFRRVTLDDCSFVTNGWTAGTSEDVNAYMRGAALYAESAPLTVRRCAFVANAQPCALDGSGGIVCVAGAAPSPSAFTNCLWAGNEEFWGGYGKFASGAGAAAVAFSAADGQADFCNCTFAYGCVSGSTSPCGVNVEKGCARIANSIFFGAITNVDDHVGTAVHVHAGAKAEVFHSMSESLDDFTAEANGDLTLGDGVVADDPLFVSGKDAVTGLVRTTSFSSGGGTFFVRRFLANGAALPILTTLNLHLRGGSGYCDEATGEKVKTWAKTKWRSPAIDAGDPSQKCVEPTPNGRRVNMGAYGNSPWATMSVRGGALIVR